jgi:hypothetical protein
MADNQNTDLPEPFTRQYFPEAIDKIVELVELSVESGFYGITIRFQDKTALTFVIEPCVFTFPVYEDWADGEAKILKQYEPIRSEIEET